MLPDAGYQLQDCLNDRIMNIVNIINKACAVLFMLIAFTGCGNQDEVIYSPYAAKVFEYTPAPGQFINMEAIATPEDACAYAQRMLDTGSPLSLGGFGGYVVVGFDHSIEAADGWNLEIRGNAYSNSSEPGIVWVMEDSNANGLPDDVWYELKGSEYGLKGTVQAYSVTYYRPDAPHADVRWTDNLGNEGIVAYLPSFHNQDSYYPAWITADSYTLTGTCLEARNEDVNGDGSLWLNKDYDWGYADNFSTEDMLSGWTCFRFSNAMDASGKPVKLQKVDFVKVQSAVNASSGWTGEISTEVSGIADYNLVSQ